MSRPARKEKKRQYYAIILTTLFIWFVFVLCFTILGRRAFDGRHFQPELFWSYRSVQLKEAWFIRQILGNVAMYIPLGFVFPFLFKDRLEGWKVFIITLLVGVAVSFFTESMQYIFKIGLFEFDDIIHNALGTVIGFVLYRVVRNSYKRHRHRHRSGFINHTKE